MPAIFSQIGVHVAMWVLILVALICVALIIWGLIPSKAKDWSQEKVQLLWPEGHFDKKQKGRK